MEASHECPCLGVVGIQDVLFWDCFHPSTPRTFMAYSVLLRKEMELANGKTCVSVDLYKAILTCNPLQTCTYLLNYCLFPLACTLFASLFVPAVPCSQLRQMEKKGRALWRKILSPTLPTGCRPQCWLAWTLTAKLQALALFSALTANWIISRT
jgi:hypothetical protein